MRIGEDHIRQEIEKTLDALQIRGASKEKLMEYLDPDKPGDESLLEGLEQVDFGKQADQRRSQMASRAGQLPLSVQVAGWVSGGQAAVPLMTRFKRSRPQMCGRLIRALYAVGGPSMIFALQETIGDDGKGGEDSISALLGPEAEAALLAEAYFRQGKNTCLRNLIQIGEKNPALLLAARNQCRGQRTDAQAALAAVYLYAAGEKKRGFFQKLLGGEDRESGQMKEILNSSVCRALEEMTAKSCTPGQRQELERYLENGNADGPLSKFLEAALSSMQFFPYSALRAAVCALLAREYTPAGERFLTLCLHFAPWSVLAGAWWSLPRKRMEEQVPWLAAHLSVEKFLLTKQTGLGNGNEMWLSLVRQLNRTRAAEFAKGASQAMVGENREIQDLIRQAAPDIARAAADQGIGLKRKKTAQNLAKCFPDSNVQRMAEDYLVTGENLDQLAAQAVGVKNNYGYDRELSNYISLYGEDDFTLRCLAVCVLAEQGYRLSQLWFPWKGNRKEQMRHFLELEEKAGLSAAWQLRGADLAWGTLYSQTDKNQCMDAAVAYLVSRHERTGTEWPAIAAQGSVFARYAAISAMDAFPGEYKETLLSCAGDGSKQVKELLTAVYAGHPEWEEDIRSMLASKKSALREMALEVISKWDVARFREDLEGLLEKEKSQKVAARCRGLLGLGAEGTGQNGGTGTAEGSGAAGPGTAEELAVSLLKGGKKRRVQWLFDTAFLPVKKKDGSQASEELLAALLVGCQDCAGENPAQALALLKDELEPRSLEDFVCQVWDRWMEQGAPAKQKWILSFTSAFGGREAVSRMKHQISQWPQNARGAIACDAVYALALSPEPEALLIVDSISRKFKFKQVKAAAGKALMEAAKKRNLTPEELADRIVPDLGFGEDLSQTFDYGPRHFTVYLSPSLELEIQDQNGKRLKSLPAPGKNDDPEKAQEASARFKALKKQMKAVVSTQKLRLEQALSINRKWQVSDWEKLFVKNPVMHQFAISLIWGIYQEDQLLETFRYMEDGSFNTMDEEEYELPSEGTIGLVHPIELKEEELSAWKQQLEDYEVEQSIEQLKRPVFSVTPEEKGQKRMERFGGRMVMDLSLFGKLQSMGWYRGSVQDGGGFYEFYREDGKISVNLTFSGSFVSGEGEMVTVYDAVFYRTGTVRRGSYIYDRPKDEDTLSLDEVNPRYFSEIVYQLQKATASGTEMNHNWKNERF